MARLSTEEAVARLRSFGPTCSPRQLASVLGSQPYYYNMAARNGDLPFKHCFMGQLLKISTESVISFITDA